MFEHKIAHKCTWYQSTLGQRPMINFVIVSSDLQPCVLGSWVKRGTELSTDHLGHRGGHRWSGKLSDWRRSPSGTVVPGDSWGSFWTPMRGVTGRWPEDRITFFADDAVLMASLNVGLQRSLNQFAAQCEAAAMKISTYKSEAMVLSRKPVLLYSGWGMSPCPKWRSSSTSGFCSWVRDWWGVRLTGESEQWVRCCMCFTARLWWKGSWAGRQSSRSIYVNLRPTLTYGHEWWVITKRMRSWVQAAKMGFLHRVAGVSLRDRVRSSAIREGLRVKPLLLGVERSQFR